MAGDTSLVYNILARDKAGPVLARSAASVRAAALSSAASTAVMGAAWASAGAWAIALGAAVRPAVGAIALVPAVAFAAAAGIGALVIATKGMGAAWTAATAATGAGGGAAASTARQVAAATRQVRDATRALTDAQTAELAAQQAITRAYAEATERLEDLDRAVTGARLDEKSAVLAVAEAARDLQRVRSQGGDVLAIRRAQLAYEQSKQTLDEVRDRVGDLTAEQERAQAAGVAGSDEVVSATERHDEAVRRVTEATERLADAQQAVADAAKGAGGGVDQAAAALAKLSPNARAVVTTLLALRTEWGAVKRQVSDATWRNVAGDIRALSSTYLPVMRTELVAVGGGWNTMIRSTLGMLRTRDTVDDIRMLLANTAVTVGRLGQAFSHVLRGLIGMGAAGSTFLPGLAQSALQLAERFERWVASARESGKLAGWISQGLTTLKQLGSIALNVGSAIGAIFKAGEVGGLLGDLDAATARMATFLHSKQGQQQMAATLGFLRDILGSVVTVLGGLSASGTDLTGVMGGASDTLAVAASVMGFLADHMGLVAALLPVLIPLWIAQSAGLGPTNILLLARIVAEFRLAAALRANTAMMMANTVSQNANNVSSNVGVVARVRAMAAAVAHRVATIAMTAVTWAATAAQWAWNVAMSANPIGLIILGVIALIAGIVLLWRNSETFRNIVTTAFGAVWTAIKFVWEWIKTNWPLLLAILGGPIGLAVYAIVKYWDQIKAGASAVWQWIVDKWDALYAFFAGLPGRLAAVGRNLFSWVRTSFQSAINWVLDKWNRLYFRIPPISVPGLGQVWGGLTLNTPDIPLLDTGGRVLESGLAVIHQGETVVPARTSPLSTSGGGSGTREPARLEIVGERGVVDFIRRLVRDHGNGDVQVAFGRS